MSAYEYLRDNVEPDISGTARLLQETEGNTSARIADELEELAGAFDGTHQHGDQRDDIILEASQVFDRLLIGSLSQQISAEQLNLPQALSASSDAVEPATATALLNSEARKRRGSTAPVEAADVITIVENVSRLVSALGIAPLEIVEADLSEMHSREYLEPFFESH